MDYLLREEGGRWLRRSLAGIAGAWLLYNIPGIYREISNPPPQPYAVEQTFQMKGTSTIVYHKPENMKRIVSYESFGHWGKLRYETVDGKIEELSMTNNVSLTATLGGSQ